MLRSLQTVTRNRKTFRSFLNKTSLKSCCQTTPQLISTLFIQQQVSFSSTRLVDELNHDRVSSVVLTSKIDADDPLSHEIYRYDIDFKANCKDIQFAQEGAYLDLTPAMMEKYLPEGGSGEMSNEMKATRKNAFMVRESSKLVCRSISSSSLPLTFPLEFLMTLLIK